VSTSADVRARAARIVAQVATHGRSLDALLAAANSSTAQERGLLRTLCYDTVRWYVRLDALLARLLARPNQSMTPEVHALALVGLCQLLYTDIPAHAAVDETVNAARVLGQPRAAGLLNAVLRRCQRDGAKLAAAIDGDTALRHAHPRWFVDMLAADWPDTFEQILLENNQRPPFWLRVNRLRGTGREYRQLLETSGFEVAGSLFDDQALLLAQAVDVGELPGFSAGLVSVQDAAAQLAAHVLAPQPGDRVLDACSAPGGKACHLLELQPQVAQLVAVDVSKERLERVTENLERLGLRAQLVTGDAADPATWWDGRQFQRILLDVPCSATGVIRRHPDIKLLRRAADIAALADRQRFLLESAWTMLAPGGRLLYASCSALRAENAAVVDAFLSADTGALDRTPDALATLGIGEAEPSRPEATGYAITAGTRGMDGFYYACLEKMKG
jgi:16S rRNA (cytosine967-C5)-methyltransferase